MTSIDYYGTVRNQGYDVDAVRIQSENPNAGPAELEEMIRAERIDATVKVRQLKERRKLKG